MKILNKNDLIYLINEEIKTFNCEQLKLNQETINYINKFKSSEDLLKNGGLPIDILDRLAFGFSEDDIKTLIPNQLNIKWKDDLKNVIYEQEKSGLSKIDYAKRINLSEPIDVIYEKDKFWIDDGHHRYYAAKILNKPLNINLEIKQNPIIKLGNGLDYDNFHRCIFNQVKNIK
jgi:hypothetical protein